MKISLAAAPGGGGVDPQQLALLSGERFCQALVDQLAEQFGADLVSIGERRLAKPERIRMLASRFDGLPLGDFEYDSRQTPCSAVLQSGQVQVISGGVQQRYPKNAMFAEEGIRSYAGVALCQAGGGVTGLIQAAWRRDISAGTGRQAAALMQRFAPRLAAEVSTLQTRAVLTALAGGGAGGGAGEAPQDALRLLACQLQRAFRVRAAFIAAGCGSPPERYRIVAAATADCGSDAQDAAPVAYEGTPCARVAGGEEHRVPAGLQADFAMPAAFAAPDLDAYLGIPLFDAGGAVIGHLRCCTIRRSAGRIWTAGCWTSSRRGSLWNCAAAARSGSGRSASRRSGPRPGPAASAGWRAPSRMNSTMSWPRCRGAASWRGPFWDRGHPAEPHVAAVEDGLQAAALLVRQLLMYAERGCGQAQAPCDLNAVVRAALSRPDAAPAAQPELQLDLAPGVLTGQMDRTQVTQLVCDLVRNAQEAVGAGGGRVHVATRRCRPGPQERRRLLKGGETLTGGDCLLLEVRDTGCGMAPETVARIFDPFFTTKPDRRGLGLAAVPGVVSRHRGALAVDSSPGQGSVFRFYFPACDEAEQPAGGAAAASPAQTGRPRSSAGPRRILVVDDEDTVRRAVAGLLQLRGCAVALADGGAAAMELLDRRGRLTAR